MSEQLPEPLVPADVDLSGFSGFMLNVDRVLSSELHALCTPEEGWAAFNLWMRAWKQTPPASLPDDDRLLAKFSGAGARWPKVRDMALRGFVLCKDGRLYHRTLAVEALEAWERRVEHQEKQENRNTRQARWRARLKDITEQLRERGVTPPKGASLKELETLLRRHVDVYKDVSRDGVEIGRDRDRDRDKGDSLRSSESVDVYKPSTEPDPEPPDKLPDDAIPTSWEGWRDVFAQEFGQDVSAYDFRQRLRFKPLADKWIAKGISVGQMREAHRKAESESTEAIADIPSYLDRVLVTVTSPKRSTADDELKRVAEGLTGRKTIDAPRNDPTTASLLKALELPNAAR